MTARPPRADALIDTPRRDALQRRTVHQSKLTDRVESARRPAKALAARAGKDYGSCAMASSTSSRSPSGSLMTQIVSALLKMCWSAPP